MYINQSKFETLNLMLRFYRTKMIKEGDEGYNQRNLALPQNYNQWQV